jgi:hypothetical protein
MQFKRAAILAGAAALLVAGAAEAATAELHRINVALPDGSVAKIEYQGDVAPQVTVVPVDPFAGFEQIAAMMEMQRQAMLQQIAALQEAAAQGVNAAPGQTLVATGKLPAGVSYSYFSSTTDANGCTQTVQYSSDGSGEQPKVTRASAGNCDAVPENGTPQPAEAPAPTPDIPLSQQV